MLWKLISKILDWLKGFVNGKIQQDRKDRERIEEIDRKMQEMEQEARERHEKAKENLPTDGDDMVEYWRTRLPSKGSDRP